MPGLLAKLITYHDRYGRRTVWAIAGLIMLIACGFYVPKAQEDRSAFIRWRHQILELWKGHNIYNEMMFPNPPIMPISLYPLMKLPPVVGATAWFVMKVGLTAVAFLLCLRMAEEHGRPTPAWAEGFVIFLSIRPILSDLHHGNINLLILFLIVACLYAWRKGYDVLAGVCLGLAIAYKVTPALFVPYFMYKRSWRTVVSTMLAMGIFFLVVPSLVLGVQFNSECLSMWWNRILSPYITHDFVGSEEINQSMIGVLSRLLTENPTAPDHRYSHFLEVNLVAWDPRFVTLLLKGLSVGLVGMLAFFCRTKTNRRDDARLLGEFSLVVLTMLFMSERSWKHHFVTLLLPYTYLVYRSWVVPVTPRVRNWITVALWSSVLLIASTSSEIGGLLVTNGHKVAQAYGMFCWAAFVLYLATAWRVYVEGREVRKAEPPDGPGVAPAPHFGNQQMKSVTTST